MQPATSTRVDPDVGPRAFGLLTHASSLGTGWGAMAAQGPGWRILTWPSSPADALPLIASTGFALGAGQFDGPFVALDHAAPMPAAWGQLPLRQGRVDGLHTLFVVVPGTRSHAVVVTQDPQWRRNDAALARALCADVLTQGPKGRSWRCGPLSVGPNLFQQGCTGTLHMALNGLRGAVSLEQSLMQTSSDGPPPASSEALSARLDAALADVDNLGLRGAMPCVARRSASTARRVGEERAVLTTIAGAPPTWWLRGTYLWRVDDSHTVQLLATARCPAEEGPAVLESLHALCAAWERA